MNIIENDLFFSYKKNNLYSIFATIEEDGENNFEVAIWTDTIHFESDEIKYSYFKTIEESKEYIVKQFLNFK